MKENLRFKNSYYLRVKSTKADRINMNKKLVLFDFIDNYTFFVDNYKPLNINKLMFGVLATKTTTNKKGC